MELHAATVPAANCSIGVIGSGNYATGVLIPAVKEAGARLKVVASSAGVSGLHAGRKFGFEQTTTDTASVLSDFAVNAVVITTRHDSHAGAGGVIESLAGRSTRGTWIDMSTNDQDETLRLGAMCEAKGINVLESPVTGGVHKAAHGDITVLVGGEEAVFKAHEKALNAMGQPVLYIGKLGSAAVIKVITNMLAFIHLVAAGEALMLAKRGGLDLGVAFEAIKQSSGNSFVHETESQVILNGSYNINFTMDLALKDMGFALGYGKEFGVPLALATLTNEQFVLAKAAYGGEAWSSQVVKSV